MQQARAFDRISFRPHDHGSCSDHMRAAVERSCAERGLRLTPTRACVLEALIQSHRAMTAYELLDRLREAGLAHQPPVVYRALDFLVGNGFAHRIERLGAFVACRHAGEAHPAAFLVCRSCRHVAEAALDGPSRLLSEAAGAVGFRAERMTIEAEGLCEACSRDG
jgi:Fur family zinc uptake transcriptional regulator